MEKAAQGKQNCQKLPTEALSLSPQAPGFSHFTGSSLGDRHSDVSFALTVKKRSWDRNYYQRHKIKRQAANNERRAKLYEYLQQIKTRASCSHCGENHPATLQFHHRDPSQKEFTIGEFVTRQLGGIEKLKKEIEKCDVVCANCHLKYHYNHRRQARILVEPNVTEFEE